MTHTACQSIFLFCSTLTDETDEIKEYKYIEEQGEFFKEYLVYRSKELNLVCSKHRQTSIEIIIEEAIDCLIVASKINNNMLPLFGNPEITTEFNLQKLAQHIMARDCFGIASELSHYLASKEYYALLHKKLMKWAKHLVINAE